MITSRQTDSEWDDYLHCLVQFKIKTSFLTALSQLTVDQNTKEHYIYIICAFLLNLRLTLYILYLLIYILLYILYIHYRLTSYIIYHILYILLYIFIYIIYYYICILIYICVFLLNLRSQHSVFEKHCPQTWNLSLLDVNFHLTWFGPYFCLLMFLSPLRVLS